MRMPATSERIRMYSADWLAATATSEMLGSRTDDIDAIKSFQPQGSF